MTPELLGRWSYAGRLIEVASRGDDLVVAFPDVPAEYAPQLHRDSGSWVMVGGPYDGLTVDTVERDGAVHLLVGGAVTFPRWTDPPGAHEIRGLPAWPDPPDPDTERRYAAVLDEVRGAGGGVVHPPPEVALGSWVRWLTDRDEVLFHGSANGRLDELRPRRTSYEINDEAQRGNRAAVYATDDGWWSMWFSIIDRDQLRGSMRSGVERFGSTDQPPLRVYQFSLDHRVLASRPFADGWLYVLPRDSFERLPVVPGGPPSHEWCGEQAVKPLARLPVRPADFPFIDRISGHDDGDLLRLDELAEFVRERVAGGFRTPDGVVLRLRWDGAVAAVRDEYLSLSRRHMPEVTRSFEEDTDGTVWLRLASAGPLVTLLHHSYADLLQQDP